MSDQDYKEAVAGLRAMRPPYFGDRIKVTGYLNIDGTLLPDPTTNAQSGNLWVHGYPRGANVQVLIGPNIDPHVPNVRVWVGQNHAGQAVAHDVVVDKNAVAQFGPGLNSIAQPQNVPAMALIPGRPQPSEDTACPMCVHVNGFDYDDGVFLGGTWSGGNFDPTTYDFDVSASVPVANGYSVWVRIWFDPITATLHHLAGTPVYTGNNPWVMDEQAIPNISIPDGVYPTGAVVLTYGQTTLAGGYFATNRYLLGKTEIELNDVMMSADGFPMVSADGFFMLSS
jgi:hypothetical protein